MNDIPNHYCPPEVDELSGVTDARSLLAKKKERMSEYEARYVYAILFREDVIDMLDEIMRILYKKTLTKKKRKVLEVYHCAVLRAAHALQYLAMYGSSALNKTNKDYIYSKFVLGKYPEWMSALMNNKNTP